MSETLVVVAPAPSAPSMTYGGGLIYSSIPSGPNEGQIFFQTVLPAYSSPNFCTDRLRWMVKFINENGVGNPDTWKTLADVIRYYASADTAISKNPKTNPYDAWHKCPWPPASFDVKTMSVEKFSGSVNTPIVAFGHYLWGEGKPRSVDLSTVGLKVQANQIDPVMIAVKSYGAGTYQINGNFNRNTFDDGVIPGLYLGNITLKTEGTLKIEKNGSWNYNGVIRAFNDTYDANPSNHRSQAAEDLTTLLRITQGTPYEIRIPGEIKVSGSGKK
ncbi:MULTISPECIES: lipid II-degrading bacteriocin [Klebsiella]|uniref:lipid II-degrading bacteriocin n=1 Tax=Klebsiella TaxID=570 RepID=UPI00063C6E5A|nr:MULTISPECIES: lipid II-degrading bacteriocin [Klebsiella]KLF15318.1 hypothetical protein YA26_09955 [Klebsiella aerogenes]KLZ71163.1 hypothetical protein SL22_05555 [Klebsiella pneumoniae]